MPGHKIDERLDRHSANPKSSVHADAKKGGAGGNFTWGKPGDEAGAPAAIDKNDPNYDSSEEAK